MLHTFFSVVLIIYYRPFLKIYFLSYRIPHPTSVRFTNEEGNILEEHDVPVSPHHIKGSKVGELNLSSLLKEY